MSKSNKPKTNPMQPAITEDFVMALYKKYAKPLAAVRTSQRSFHEESDGHIVPQLDDLEAEITYLLIREFRPQCIVEIGTYHGWSTTWILSALRDNGSGHLYSFDLIDNVARNTPSALAKGRWTFVKADIRFSLEKLPENIDYLFIDAAHNGNFARWYIANLIPKVAAGTPTSVHDVFHGRRAFPFTEGRAVLKWLKDTNTAYFTASAAKAPDIYQKLNDLKKDLGLDQLVKKGRDNPMIFFRLP